MDMKIGPTPEALQEIQYQTQGAYHWDVDAKTRNGSFQILKYKTILDKVRAVDTRTVVDVGCGDGFLTSMLNKEFECYGVDFSELALNLARGKDPNLKLIRSDADKLPFQSSSIDTVCCIETLEHNPYDKAQEIVDEIYRVLKPGGSAIVSVPSSNIPLKDKHYLHYDPDQLEGHFDNFSHYELEGFTKAETGKLGSILKLSSNRFWHIPILGELGTSAFTRIYSISSPDDAATLILTATK